MILNEYNRKELIDKSKSPGFNRYKSRLNVGLNEVSIDRISVSNIDERSNNLNIYFKVRDYESGVCLVNYMARVRLMYNAYRYNYKLRDILTAAINQTLKANDVLISCTCPDFKYRFAYSATIGRYGLNTNQYIPAKIRNPDNKGSGCKHLMRILNAPYAWKDKVVTAVLRSINNNPSILGLDSNEEVR